ncbi:MAG TPA: biotin transporter BioY [Gemmatimonadales bacterium]|nr:biotin transporter BioY [Gemmatimonadales bacterium]
MERALVIDHSTLIIRRSAAVVLGALLVAGAAQVAVPLPGTPVPMTLQPMAVLLVGGLLGAPLGALSMILYLAMGAAGLPVFTPTVPLVGVARLLGPTGGYLLAYPVAAWVAGWLTNPGQQPGDNQRGAAGWLTSPGRQPGDTGPLGAGLVVPALPRGVSRPWLRTTLAVVTGLALIHLGGLAQLAILTGDISAATRFGTLPFLIGDLIKIAVLVPVLMKLAPTIRARL